MNGSSLGRMLIRARAVLLTATVLATVAGCGGDSPVEEPQGGAPPGQDAAAGLQHMHGLGVSGETVYIATHSGLWTASNGQTKARRLGASRQDIMGFSTLQGGRFVGSGHPDPGQTDLPPNLGVIESRDGGRTWTSVSLLGEADFHVLKAAGQRVYGVNSGDGALMASADGGRHWQQRRPPAGVFDLAIDPRSSQHIVVSTERGVFSSSDGGKGWRPLRDDLAGLVAWPAPDRLYLVGGDGSVQLSADGGRQWRPVGSIGGEPAAFIAHGDELYAAVSDNTVKRSVDGGRSWTLRATP